MFGPTEVFGHETMSQNLTMKGSPRGVIFIILALYARAAQEIILLVCLGHIQKIVQAINGPPWYVGQLCTYIAGPSALFE